MLHARQSTPDACHGLQLHCSPGAPGSPYWCWLHESSSRGYTPCRTVLGRVTNAAGSTRLTAAPWHCQICLLQGSAAGLLCRSAPGGRASSRWTSCSPRGRASAWTATTSGKAGLLAGLLFLCVCNALEHHPQGQADRSVCLLQVAELGHAHLLQLQGGPRVPPHRVRLLPSALASAHSTMQLLTWLLCRYEDQGRLRPIMHRMSLVEVGHTHACAAYVRPQDQLTPPRLCRSLCHTATPGDALLLCAACSDQAGRAAAAGAATCHNVDLGRQDTDSCLIVAGLSGLESAPLMPSTMVCPAPLDSCQHVCSRAAGWG